MEDYFIKTEFMIEPNIHGLRLDIAVCIFLQEFSRNKISQWIKKSCILVDGEHKKSKDKVYFGQKITIDAKIESSDFTPENIDLNIIYEDEDILVINKPSGLIVHPGSGVYGGTLLNALLYHYPDSATLPRAGIVHRLDKNTTGLMVVAKNNVSYLNLVDSLKEHKVARIYYCFVYGNPKNQTINMPIGRHKTQRHKMAVRVDGKEAVTHIENLWSNGSISFLKVQLQTGRTHQIRVHLSSMKHSLIGDDIYGKKSPPLDGLQEIIRSFIYQFPRQALHATELHLSHPVTAEQLVFSCEFPDDFMVLLRSFELSIPNT